MSCRGIARYNIEFLSYITLLNNKRLIEKISEEKRKRDILEIVDWINQSENVYLKKENLTILPLEFLEAFSKKEVYTLFSTPTGSPVYVNPSYTQATVNLQLDAFDAFPSSFSNHPPPILNVRSKTI